MGIGQKFYIGQKVEYKGKRAIIADHLNGTYVLWDETGKKALYPEDGWIDQSKISPRK